MNNCGFRRLDMQHLSEAAFRHQSERLLVVPARDSDILAR